MKKIRTIITFIIIMALMLTGCDLPEESLGEPMGVTTEPSVVATAPPDTVPVTEPMETVPAETIPATETLKDFEFGQEVWSVRQSDDGEGACLIRYAVVGQNGKLVEVVPYFTSDVRQLKESMGDTSLIEMDQVYRDKYDAMVAVAEANGETFEEYWG